MNGATERLLAAVQDLSHARDLGAVMEIVRHAARDIGQAEGATFVLRDGDKCYYADEDAISPLWKGKRFPMTACVSGWVMTNRKTASIADIYDDPRVPVEAYRPTFVKSLVMVPIRVENPIGCIGNYWSSCQTPPAETVRLLEALANFTAIAIENANLYQSLEQQVATRTAELFLKNQELETFNYSVTHDLRSPLRSIAGFSEILSKEHVANLDEEALRYLERIRSGCQRMGSIIDDLLRLSQATLETLSPATVDLGRIAREIALQLNQTRPAHQAEFTIADNLMANGDQGLLTVLLENLLGNAHKYSGKTAAPHIEFGSTSADGKIVYFIKDNGIGFDMAHAGRLFQPFQRLVSTRDFPGTGIGLATVQRIVLRHHGRIWAEAAPSGGATFFFTLAEDKPATATA